jgi:ParB-like nuclease domain
MKLETPANMSDGPRTVRRNGRLSPIDLRQIGTGIKRLPIRSVLVADSPRLDGANAEHTRMLASSGAKLPPIIVHCESMRIIDGTHRLGAALLRGEDTIEARLFDGSEHEAFLLAVRANITHGLPLSLRDRMAAAERIIGSHPTWSDGAIAEATGLGTRTVGGIRRRMGAANGTGRRMGRDGRVRPLDNTKGRLRASEIVKSRPNASLREIARDAGVSPTTARDVRDRIRRGEDPVRSVRAQHRRSSGPTTTTTTTNVTTMLRSLKNDPLLRLTESGRTLLRWVTSRAIQPEERHRVADKVPPHSTYVVAALARHCADEWLQLAADLETRTRQMA